MLEGPVELSDHVLGPDSASVTLVEYGDYGSVPCAQAHAAVVEARLRLGDRMRLVFRHFPIGQVHPNAQHAAEAAEAAGAQRRFWEMHDMLLRHQDALDDGSLLEYAELLGLDTARFLRDVAGHVHADIIRDHLRSGLRSGVDATPAFFINGARHGDGWRGGDPLLRAIEEAAEPLRQGAAGP